MAKIETRTYASRKKAYIKKYGVKAWREYKRNSRIQTEQRTIKRIGIKAYRKHRAEIVLRSLHKNPELSLLKSAKKRAKEKNLPYTITREDIFIPKKCPILNIELRRGEGKIVETSPSLDRIIPELGYVKGNVIVVSHKANRMKQDMTEDIMVTWLKLIRQTKKNYEQQATRRK